MIRNFDQTAHRIAHSIEIARVGEHLQPDFRTGLGIARRDPQASARKTLIDGRPYMAVRELFRSRAEQVVRDEDHIVGVPHPGAVAYAAIGMARIDTGSARIGLEIDPE